MKPKYSLEFRLSVINFYLSGNGARKAQQVFGVNRDTISQWVASYQQHGIDGITWKNDNHTPEFKLSVIQIMLKEGLTVREATARFNISDKSVVRRWVRVYNTSGAEGVLKLKRGCGSALNKKKNLPKNIGTASQPLEELTPEELREELRYLRAENACLKKLKALVQQEKSEKKRK